MLNYCWDGLQTWICGTCSTSSTCTAQHSQLCSVFVMWCSLGSYSLQRFFFVVILAFLAAQLMAPSCMQSVPVLPAFTNLLNAATAAAARVVQLSLSQVAFCDRAALTSFCIVISCRVVQPNYKHIGRSDIRSHVPQPR